MEGSNKSLLEGLSCTTAIQFILEGLAASTMSMADGEDTFVSSGMRMGRLSEKHSLRGADRVPSSREGEKSRLDFFSYAFTRLELISTIGLALSVAIRSSESCWKVDQHDPEKEIRRSRYIVKSKVRLWSRSRDLLYARTHSAPCPA